jgi:hypothetical protein
LEGNEMQVDKDFGVMPTEKQADETVSREGALQTGFGRSWPFVTEDIIASLFA